MPETDRKIAFDLSDIEIEFVSKTNSEPIKLLLDLIDVKMKLEQYIGEQTQFSEYAEDVVRMLKDEYCFEASITQAWQIISIIEDLWTEFKKKFVEQQKSAIGTVSTLLN